MTKPDLTNTAPKRIYLDIGDQFALERVASGDLRWDLLDGVTWSEDNATSHGIPYVRADLVPTPAASGAAPKQDGWHDPKLPPHGLLPFSFAGLSEHARGAAREYAEIYARAALASREASPATLTDEQIDEIDLRRFSASPHFLRDYARAVLALASPQVAPAPAPVLTDEQIDVAGIALLRELDYPVIATTVPYGAELRPLLRRFAHSVLALSATRAPDPVAPQDDARDAARYRFYRCVFSRELVQAKEQMDSRALDAAIDAAMFPSAPAAKPTEPTLPTQGDAK